MKGERMAKRSSFGTIMRRRLSDITNLQSQLKVSSRVEKQQQISPSPEDYINQLIQEKMTLMKVIEERNKIIELSSSELQNLRNNVQKLQLQNWNLAKTNSQFLAEVNLAREKVKSLQHEIVCRDSLLKAKKSAFEEKQEVISQEKEAMIPEVEEPSSTSLNRVNDQEKCYDRNRRRTSRSQSMSPFRTTQQKGVDNEKNKNKRHCLRRQSARSKSETQEKNTDYLFEIEDVKFVPNEKLREMQSNGATTSTNDLRTVIPPRRSYVGRPLRRAAEKVESYKEIQVNVKMRRTE